MKRLFSITLFLIAFIISSVFAQEKTIYKAETFASVSSGNYTPFEIVNHTWGMVPSEANNFYLRGSLLHEYKANHSWSFNVGVDAAVSTSSVYDYFWFQQLYAEARWKCLQLRAGTKEDYTSLLDPYLSSGDFISSNNARPIPEIRVGIPEFTLVPYTKGRMYFKGEFSVGKYFDSKYIAGKVFPVKGYYADNLYSHNKYFYLRFGNIEQKNRLQFTFGLNHDAQWGGTTYQYDWGKNEYVVMCDPHGFTDFLRVVVAKEGSSASANYDSLYVAGSHIGAFLFKFDYKLKNKDELSAYLQHYFDDGSGLAFLNYRDMLLGGQYKSKQKKLISNFVFEYIYTKNQTGPVNFAANEKSQHRAPNNRNGIDNYYNHSVYMQGHSYFGRSVGTPLLLSPEYNGDSYLGFRSNRIIAFHLGMEGYLNRLLQYRLSSSTGRSWGTYNNPYLKVQEGYSAGIDLIYSIHKVSGLDIKCSLAWNAGQFFKETAFGGGISIIKKGIIN